MFPVQLVTMASQPDTFNDPLPGIGDSTLRDMELNGQPVPPTMPVLPDSDAATQAPEPILSITDLSDEDTSNNSDMMRATQQQLSKACKRLRMSGIGWKQLLCTRLIKTGISSLKEGKSLSTKFTEDGPDNQINTTKSRDKIQTGRSMRQQGYVT